MIQSEAKMMDEDFETIKFEQGLTNLKNSQQSIQSLSNWCMQRRVHHKKIVASWLTVLKQVKIDQRLTLFNLANDVIQNSKRKNYDFVGSWGTALQRATTMVRDEPKVKQKIARIFKIWEERGIYNEEFLTDLNGLLNTVTAAKRMSADSSASSSTTTSTSKPAASAETADPDDFQSAQLIGYVNNCVRLQEKTDKAFKQLSKAPDVDVETIRQSGKDREHVEGVQQEVNDSVAKLEHYIHALKAEIKVRNIVIAALVQADEFYRSQRGDVKTVAIAYRNFGLRIKTMKKKLDELTTTLPSPMPSPDINAPSPPPDADLELPDENSFSSFFNGSAASSFLGSGQLPFNIQDFEEEEQRNPIQVINSRGEEDNHNSDYKPTPLPPLPVPPVSSSLFGHHMPFSNSNLNQAAVYTPSTPSYGTSYSAGSSQGLPPTLVPPPIPPPHIQEEYTPSSAWNAHTNSWTPTSGGGSHNNTGGPPPNKAPSSPPFFERKGTAPVAEYSEDSMGTTANDVDQRAHNPLLSKIESRLVDVDHRNLISLTGSPGGQPPNTSVPPPIAGLQSGAQKPALLPTPPMLPQGLWQQPPPLGPNSVGGVDSDFRSNYMQQQGIPPPPMPPPMSNYYGGGPGNNSFGNFPMGMFNPTKKPPQGKNGDNIDAVDMEMSDDEQDCGGGNGGCSMDGNGPGMGNSGGGGPFMNFPPPQQSPWGMNNNNNNNNSSNSSNGLHDSPANGNNHNNGPWNPSPMGAPQPGGAFFAGGGGPMFRPNNNFRGRGGFGSPLGGNGMFRGRGSPFRGGGNFRGQRGGGRGMW